MPSPILSIATAEGKRAGADSVTTDAEIRHLLAVISAAIPASLEEGGTHD